MGGSFNIQNPTPEFNVRCDPEAAQIVFSSGWKVHILGLDITRRVHFSRRDFASLPDGNPAVELLRAQAPGWIDRMEEWVGSRMAARCMMPWQPPIWLMIRSSRRRKPAVEVELADPNSRGVTRFSSRNEKHQPIVKVRLTGH